MFASEYELNFIMKNVAQRRIQVSLTSTWTLGVRRLGVCCTGIFEWNFIKNWKRKHQLRNGFKSSSGRHRSNTEVNTQSKQVNVILFKSLNHILNSNNLSLPLLLWYCWSVGFHILNIVSSSDLSMICRMQYTGKTRKRMEESGRLLK